MTNEPEEIYLVTDSTDATERHPSLRNDEVGQLHATTTNLDDVEDFSHVCRMCATVTEFVIPIFAGEGLQNNLAEKIHKHLPIQVLQEDTLPRVVCCQCASTLLAWHELVQCCVQADAALKSRALILQQSQNALNTDSGAKNEETDQQNGIWDSDWSEEAVPTPINGVTPLALRTALIRLREHLELDHGPRMRSATPESDVPRPEEEDASQYDDLTRQMRSGRMDEATRTEIAKARVHVDGRSIYACTVCGKLLSSAHTYVIHRRIHTGERPCVCHICGKQFRALGGLRRHLTETHERARRHTCHRCLRTFANLQNLKQHARIHTGERPHSCQHCGRRFTQSGSLHAHLRTHSDGLPHRCTVCGAGFRLRGGLAAHSLQHSDERPHACTRCGAAFRQRRTLRHHCRRAHPSDVPPPLPSSYRTSAY